jgi:DNA-binding response OmpR family regulator
MLIDREIHAARALLVDGNNLLRSVTAAQLRDAGVGQVVSTARVRDARVLLEQQQFDIVVCNREFEGSEDSGQDLLDELRRERLLPFSTVFLMVTGRALYHQVVEAAEGALDGFLVRPYSAAALCQRLAEARVRKRELADVLRALDSGQLELAFAQALKRFQERLPYADYCGRLAAELMLTLNRPADAKTLFDKLAEVTQAPWARLGSARADMQMGEAGRARRTLQAVLKQDPRVADAHDLLGRLLVDQSEFDAALECFRTAAGLTPGCLLRVQHAGALAFYQGRGAEARQWLERSLSMGIQSKLFDALSLLLIALLRFDDEDIPGVAAMVEQLGLFRARFPDSVRLRRLQAAAGVLATLADSKLPEATDALAALSTEAGDDDFDLEAANSLLALWSRMPAGLQQGPEHTALVERIGMRFCTAKAIGEVLVAAARRSEPAQQVIRRCQAQLLALSEAAMARAMRGDAQGAVEQLLDDGDRTLNAKLLELAALLARKHQDSLSNADALAALAAERLKRSCKTVNHIAGIHRSGRSPGGMKLRAGQPTEARHAGH